MTLEQISPILLISYIQTEDEISTFEGNEYICLQPVERTMKENDRNFVSIETDYLDKGTERL